MSDRRGSTVRAARSCDSRSNGLLAACLLVAPAFGQCTDLATPRLNGCGNSTPWGIPVISCAGAPRIGNATFAIAALSACNSTAGMLLVGTCLPTPIVIRSGFGAGGVCGPSEATCALFVDPLVLVPGIPSAGGFTHPLPIPNDSRLVGARVCVQGTSVCAIAGGSCLGASQGVALTLF